jgi:membrane-bound metal-dependent hydrolase YbcI (DUF457 family)
VNQRHAFLLMLMGIYIGATAKDRVGEDTFVVLLLIGLLIYVGWSVVAYQRGERVFIWQRSNV